MHVTRPAAPRLTPLLVIPLVVGATTYTLASGLTLLRDELGVSSAVASLVIVGIATGGLTSSALLPVITRRIGRRRTIGLGLALGSCGVALIATAGVVGLAVAGSVCTSAGGNLMMNSLSASFAVLDRQRRARWLSRAHALLSGAGLVAPLVVTAMVVSGAGWRAAFVFVAGLVLLAVAMLARIPRSEAFDAVTGPADSRGRVAGEGGRMARLVAVLVLVTAAEHATLYWAADLLRIAPGVGVELAPLAATALLAGIVVGRVVCGSLPVGDPLPVVLIGLGVAAVGWCAFWWLPNAWVALAGLAVVGLGIAPGFPLLAAAVTGVHGFAPEAAMRLVGIAVGLALAIAPMALAIVSDIVGIREAFVAVPALLAAAAGIAVTLLHMKHRAH